MFFHALMVVILMRCGRDRCAMLIAATVLQGIPLLGKATQLSVYTSIDRVRRIPCSSAALADRNAGEDGEASINVGHGIEMELPGADGCHYILAQHQIIDVLRR